MKNHILLLFALFIVSPLFPMRPPRDSIADMIWTNHQLRNAQTKQKQKEEQWQKILAQPINDELLRNQNPVWDKTKRYLSQTAKNKLLKECFNQNCLANRESWMNHARSRIIEGLYFGADPNVVVTRERKSCLLFACEFNDYHLARYLKSKGATLGPAKASSLLITCKSVQFAKLFIEFDAHIPSDILQTCCNVKCPAELLQFYIDKDRHKRPGALNHILFHLIEDNQIVQEKQARSQIEKVKMLINAKADVNDRDTLRHTPLHMCCAKSDNFGDTLCELLVNANCLVNAQNVYGHTPLMIATLRNNATLCNFLLTHGAEIMLRNRKGETALILDAKEGIANNPSMQQLVYHQRSKEISVIALLSALKRCKFPSAKELCRQSKDLLQPYFIQHMVKGLLCAKDNEGKTAYDYAKMDYKSFRAQFDWVKETK